MPSENASKILPKYNKLSTMQDSALWSNKVLFILKKVFLDFSFVSNVTESLTDNEFEQFVSLFAAHAECGLNQSLDIGTRRKLNKIFGREANKLLTIEPKERDQKSVVSHWRENP